MATRTINAVRNVKWSDKQHTTIDMEVDFDELDEVYVPFTASPNDSEPHGVLLYNNAINGEYGEIGDWVPPSDLTGEDAEVQLRVVRNALLSETDYIEMPTRWATLSDADQTAWTNYRQALRDLPQNYPNASYVFNVDEERFDWVDVTFPTKP